MEEEVELCDAKLSSSYEMPLVTIKEFETESVIKGYHAYMNDWTQILGENVSIRRKRILFKREEIYIEVSKKTVELVTFIIVCALEILSIKYEEYQYYH